ncbi:hypothetical protein Val02_77340 [Virgisporangium aliadipatigenens]|uniref:Matrixin family metalloprotease n=1 Tax=Virgisporangium aliadipatigenens TaxID=741659 RepID=A0A8J4DV69_9ACTN|nr:hypothetical protein [Virgisporangium aliadipatigenens]GIJ50848.1 hypothetical protein Val02_77340 [Virgisporangium aliadipatigenens]
MNQRRRTSSVATALLAAVALLATPPAGPFRFGAGRPDTCPHGTGTVDAAALAEATPITGCRLGGAVVASGELSVRVPDDDGSVTAAGMGRTGHPAVLTVTRIRGKVRAIVSGRARTENEPSQAIERFGRADGSSTESAGEPAAETAAVDPRCADAAGTWLGMRWRNQYKWWLRNKNLPGYLGSADPVRDAIRAAGAGVDDGRNDCGLGGGLALSQRYIGDTDKDANIRPDGTCGSRDDRNVVAFGELSGGLLALTCLWWSRGRTVEADIRISDVDNLFSLAPTESCADTWDLQGTLTHEFGHVFGLGHVTFAEHGELTMSDGLPACSTRFRALGLGDYQTLKNQYG